jgi:hypothetical protein
MPPSGTLRAIVAIPVRNEAAMISACLGALLDQVDLTGRALDPRTFEIVLLLNNCTDGSAAVVRRTLAAAARQGRLLPQLRLIETDLPAAKAHVGWARRLAMEEAYRRFALLRHPGGIIATTDADTIVAPDWLAATIVEIQHGADAVGGRLMLSRREQLRLPDDLRRLAVRHRRYERLTDCLMAQLDPDASDPWPRHGDHGGASIAATAAAYRRAGGMPPLASSEDQAFYRAVKRSGGRFRHSLRVKVYTSARLQGRAAGGMAAALTGWSARIAGNRETLVENPVDAERRFARRAALRRLWRDGEIEQCSRDALLATGEAIGIASSGIELALDRAASCEDFLTQLCDEMPRAAMPLGEATFALGQRLLRGASTDSR